MNKGKYVFSQVVEFIPHYYFNQCVERYKGHYRVKSFSCWEQLLAMIFGQLAYRESIRDIAVCLRAQKEKLYHLGFSSVVAKTTLARVNETRDWRIYRDFTQVLILKARKLYIDDNNFSLELDGACYALDSSTIDLCLSFFRWAKFKKTKSAVKLHLGLDLRGNIPAFFHITNAKTHDINFLDVLEIEIGAYYIMDRGYLDFKRLFKIHRSEAFFVVRAKSDLAFRRIYSNKIDKTIGIRCDQVIKFIGPLTKKKYPNKLRRIKYFDKLTNNYYVFLTNNFKIEAKTVADIYKYRWQIELFFKWIKQHLKIKSFWGHSANAVKTQICIAICAYLLVAIIKKRLNIERNIYEILQILSVSLFDKTPLNKLISEFELQTISNDLTKQASLFDF